MKVTKWFGAAVALFFLLCAVLSPEYVPGQPRFQYGNPPTHSGRPLTPREDSTLQQAAVNIFTPPPDSLTFADENGDSHTVSCQDIGLDLLEQLADSHVQAETLKKGGFYTLPDSSPSPQADQMNVDPALVAWAPVSAAWMRQLEACLVHEWWHKNQDTASLRNNDNREEVAPYGIMAAYYCSTAVVPGDTNDPFTKWAKFWQQANKPPQTGGRQIRAMLSQNVDRHFVFLKLDTVAINGSDSLLSLGPDDGLRHSFALAPMRGSDLAVIEDPPFLPPGHKLMAVFGGFPLSGVARILLLDYFEGQVIAPVWNHDFGPPAYSPMFFYSASKQLPDGPWFVLDTLNHQILLMQDAMYNDDVPDEIVSVFASASWPGMAPLANARGLEAVAHPFIGPGLMVLEEGAHFQDALYPHDWNYFLIDPDGDLHADAMLSLPLYEFLSFTPVIQVPRPWPGDMSLTLFASWEHDIAVWKTDSTGEMLIEQLGLTHMAPGVDAECLLSRPLLPEEYIMSLDMQNGRRSRPIQVIAPVPEHLVISVGPGGGIIFLSWDPVPGASEYAIWMSEDGVTFFDSGLRTVATEFALPVMNKQFYRVTALR